MENKSSRCTLNNYKFEKRFGKLDLVSPLSLEIALWSEEIRILIGYFFSDKMTSRSSKFWHLIIISASILYVTYLATLVLIGSDPKMVHSLGFWTNTGLRQDRSNPFSIVLDQAAFSSGFCFVLYFCSTFYLLIF